MNPRPLKRKYPRFKCRSRLRPVSAKRRKLNAEAREEREAFAMEFPVCMYPNCKNPSVDTHEITNASRRGKSLAERAVLLRLCRAHHDELTGLPLAKKWSVQLAIKKLSDPESYCLATFRRIMDRGNAVIVSEEEIEVELKSFRAE